ncbi:MAG: RNA-binding transcriptional accessory protein [Clostridia bacterium]|nr:RNA-binding transcriptional accessory protein [Clostridia bacterium]
MEKIIEKLMQEFDIKKVQIESTIKLIEEGNTIPFIARYRKEITGNLSDETLRNLNIRLTYLKNLETRKEEVIRHIRELEMLTSEIELSILNSTLLSEIEDIYRPYKPKKRTKATIAKEKGLEPLSQIILKQSIKLGDINDIAKDYLSEEKGILTAEDAINGACDIIAENISDNPEYRKYIRRISYITGKVVTSAVDKDEKTVYDMYYEFSENINKIPGHRILAINRGEREKALKVKFDVDEDQIFKYLNDKIILSDSIVKDILTETYKDAYKKYIKPSIEREIWSDKFEDASEKAIKVFGVNSKNLLMQAPLKGLTVMGFDPAYRTGCKIAIIDDTGKLLTTTTVYPTLPQEDVAGAEKELINLIKKYNVDMIAIGNGTASRESEKFVSDMIKKLDKKIYYTIVNEAGASVYSASELATKEYPDINVSLRGAISIARRLQDPLAELVKIDPKSIGVGQYQHDVNQKRLEEALTGVVEDAVNTVGVDLNTATPSLLSYVSGVNKNISNNIVKYREEIGKFKSRNELLKVSKLGKATFIQCAGFLKIPEAKNILDNTMVHPESYEIAAKLIKSIGYDIKNVDKIKLSEISTRLGNVDTDKLSIELDVGKPTIEDIIKELQKPGRDPRENMPKPILKSDVLKLEDLKEGMELTGTVRNVIDFGAFVDIGIKNDGLVHISQISDKYVRNPMEEVSVGDIVRVKVIGIDKEKGKVSLSMKGLN